MTWPTSGAGVGGHLDAELSGMAGQAQVTLGVLAGKWVIPVIDVLSRGPRRHGELRRALGPVLREKVMTETLRRMEAAGLVRRRVVPVLPPSVLYSLTELGLTLLEPMRQLAQWADRHADQVRIGSRIDAAGESHLG